MPAFATPTTDADKARINSMFHASKDMLANLAGRWRDECAYENINDYQKAMQDVLPEGFKIVKMMKRPFGFMFTIGTSSVYGMRIKGNYAEWMRLA